MCLFRVLDGPILKVHAQSEDDHQRDRSHPHVSLVLALGLELELRDLVAVPINYGEAPRVILASCDDLVDDSVAKFWLAGQRLTPNGPLGTLVDNFQRLFIHRILKLHGTIRTHLDRIGQVRGRALVFLLTSAYRARKHALHHVSDALTQIYLLIDSFDTIAFQFNQALHRCDRCL